MPHRTCHARVGPVFCSERARAIPLTVILLLKNLIVTIVAAGVFAGWLPLRWFERYPRWPAPGEFSFLHAIGLGLCALGAAGYLNCLWHFMHRGEGTPAPIDPPKRLIQRGLYRCVRNPIYLSLLLFVAGEALYLRSWHIGVYLFCLACVLHLVVLLWEESDLSFRYGAMYEDYRRAVPRWMPRRPKPREEYE